MTDSSDAVRLLGRIEERTEGIGDDVREIKLMLQVQNGRIRDLERKQDQVAGGWKATTFIGGIAGTIGGIAAKWFGF